MSARDPVNCDVIPSDLTDGACEAGAGPTSKLILEKRCPSRGLSPARIGSSLIKRNVNVEKSSERVLDADTTRMLSDGFRYS